MVRRGSGRVPARAAEVPGYRIVSEPSALRQAPKFGVRWGTMEFAFRALPEHELRVADVAFVSRERLNNTDPDDNLHGAPDVVVEVFSPSNTVAEIVA